MFHYVENVDGALPAASALSACLPTAAKIKNMCSPGRTQAEHKPNRNRLSAKGLIALHLMSLRTNLRGNCVDLFENQCFPEAEIHEHVKSARFVCLKKSTITEAL